MRYRNLMINAILAKINHLFTHQYKRYIQGDSKINNKIAVQYLHIFKLNNFYKAPKTSLLIFFFVLSSSSFEMVLVSGSDS